MELWDGIKGESWEEPQPVGKTLHNPPVHS